MEKLFIVTPVPHAWTAKMNFHPNEFFWDDVSIPKDVDIEYVLKIKYLRMKDVRVDYFHSSTPIASEDTKCLCDSLGVNCQFVPVKISVNNLKSSKQFYFLLLRDYISIVDMTKSTYEIMRDKNTGKDLRWPNFPNIPMYEKISNLILKEGAVPHFFMAREIGARVCTERFKEAVEKLGLEGMNFKEISSDFCYDPFSFISRPTPRV